MFQFKQLFIFLILNYLFYNASAFVGNLPGMESFNKEGNWNSMFDNLLNATIKKISGDQVGLVEMGAHESTIPKYMLCGPGTFTFDNATVGDLLNLTRKGDFKLFQEGQRFALEIGLQMHNLTANLNNYKIKYCKLSKRGSALITVKSISMSFRQDINFGEGCKLHSEDLDTDIQGVHFELKGGRLDRFINRAVNLAVKYVVPFIVGVLKTKLKKSVAAPLETFNCVDTDPRTSKDEEKPTPEEKE